ncbi:MAG: glycoside hydrolase family 3 N-terminal domain-containing protein [Bacteroidota bacterium]|nr:glycoside hydrolase family 3 N-terminal domain-containing protein [Bacteroidota bacterium]
MKKSMLHIGLILTLLITFTGGIDPLEGNREDVFEAHSPPFLLTDTVFIDSIINNMTVEEKIGQLLMVAAYSNKDQKHEDYIEYLVKEKNIGGLIFMQGGPQRQAKLIKRYQQAANVPLMLAMDAEWGPSMRLDSTILYPRQMMLGAVQNDDLIYQAGAEYARQLKNLGIHINFAPVVDVNVNPENPVINSRSFGENPEDVARKAYYYAKGMQDNKVLAVAKHFPGHGDTDKDSHKTLPTVPHDLSRLDSVELYPFRKLINSGIGGVMVAHLYVPELDPEPGRASTLSPRIVTELLKHDLGFEGLVFTDALNMKAVADYYEPGEVVVEAFMAGNDVLLFPSDVPGAIKKMKLAVDEGRIDINDLNSRVSKILAAKQWMGILQDSLAFPALDVQNTLLTPQAKLVHRRIVENAVTLVDMKDSILPVKHIEDLQMASLDLGSYQAGTFQKRLKSYANVPAYVFRKDAVNFGKTGLIDKLANNDLVFVAVTETNRIPSRNFGFSNEEMDVIRRLSKKTKVVLCFFGNPYALRDFNGLIDIDALVVAYNDREITQDVTAQMVYGGLPFKGRLPVSINLDYQAGTGIDAESHRLAYTDIPEQVGINSAMLDKVDSLLQEAIHKKATPGAQVLVARHGTVFFHEAYGYHTYQKQHPVRLTDIYDLASVTKIVATTASLMYLYDRDEFRLNDSLVKHLPWLAGTNKAQLVIKDILTHQARLRPWIPFYIHTIKPEVIADYYSQKMTKHFDVQVAENLFALHGIRDSIIKQIVESDLRCRKAYKYSDLGFYLMREFIEDKTGCALNRFVDSVFYKPLGAVTLGYHPLEKFPASNIVPTENDKRFRKQLLHGYVHDQGAAMLGGVSGHAGVFSNANDLAKIMQMFLNKGAYGGKQYFHPETLQMFSSPLRNPSQNRRGLGFDKPVIDEDDTGPVCNSASPESFGHSGFTGILAWVDPETDLLYVFLSNRVCPDMDNKKLLDMDIRTNVQEVFYKAIMDKPLCQ